MRFPVFLDTNVLYPVSLADTLLRLAEAEVIRPHWSADVMKELVRNLGLRIPEDMADKRARAMQTAFPEAMVTGYEALIDAMGNDPKDRHVLAAAVHSDCEVIVTFDASGFSSNALAPHHLVAVHPDEFLLDQLDLYPGLVRRALERQAAATARPHLTTLDLMDHLNQIGLHGFAAQLRRRWPDMAR
ncbi:PIN domain-containing protein [Enemella evansiae]|uniref:PIN domain-containing protein n=2 Tax=Enemella evansiae TaxID=2016499 RepID=A0A255GWI6_9ACTN|nr:PIN domain-containing protein [Enemella evansiae]OYN97174.1 PIN domain-containing protein [Enemella evansiae]OYO06060.1 PIN domain-containing protein [Enemella evansiae]OYO13022.1 PIN domain-containing protein [Enemella evansiae]OYO17814.1 PIN domain-containing protein [Enemella evansiae]